MFGIPRPRKNPWIHTKKCINNGRLRKDKVSGLCFEHPEIEFILTLWIEFFGYAIFIPKLQISITLQMYSLTVIIFFTIK